MNGPESLFVSAAGLLVLVCFASVAEGASARDYHGFSPDPIGDVIYDSMYSGQESRAHVDLTGLAFAYNLSEDEVFIELAVVDGIVWQTPPENYHIRCSVRGDMVVVEDDGGTRSNGWVTFWVQIDTDGSLSDGVEWTGDADEGGGDGGTLEPRTEPLGYALARQFDEGAAFNFSTPRGQLLRYGDRMMDLAATCRETYYPAVVSAYMNYDPLDTRLAIPALADLPMNGRGEQSGAPEGPRDHQPDEAVEAPALGGALPVVLGWLVFVRRRRRIRSCS